MIKARRNLYKKINRLDFSNPLRPLYLDAYIQLKHEINDRIESTINDAHQEYLDKTSRAPAAVQAQIIKRVRRRKMNPNSCFGVPQDKADAFRTFFAGRFNGTNLPPREHSQWYNEPPVTTLSGNTTDSPSQFSFTEDEVGKALSLLPWGKAPGPSGLQSELIQAAGTDFRFRFRLGLG